MDGCIENCPDLSLLHMPFGDRSFLDALSDAVFLIDAATGGISDCNHAACELAGQARNTLLERHISDLHPAEDKARCLDFLARCRADPQPRALCRTQPMTLLRADHTSCSCRLTLFIRPRSEGAFVCALYQPPYLEALRETRLQDSEADFATVLPHTQEGIWSWTPATDEVFLSRRWKEQLGFAPEEFPHTAQACNARIHPDDYGSTIAAMSECAAGATPSFSLEFRMRRKDGTYIWIHSRGAAVRDASGRIARVAGSNLDVTARKEAAQALRESEERFRLLARNTPDAIFLHDMSGKVLDANDQACALLGYDTATLKTLNVTDFEASCPPEVLHGIWDAMEPGPFNFEGLARRRDGATFPTEVRGVAFLERGRLLGLVAARDLSARKAFERSLAEARDAAMAASRAKTEFLASMSHEIRTPMNIILGMAELLGETAVTSAQKRYLAAIEHSGRMLLHLINDILDLSQIEANRLELRPETFGPAELLRAACDLMRVPAEEKGLTLALRLDDDLPGAVTNDCGRLRQVLMNLIWNGVKFTAEGGIEVYAERFPADAGLPPGLRVTVADTGAGIAAETADSVFDPFTQSLDGAGRRPAGTGLGLAICKRLVELMGGRITLASSPGQGSRFTFTLPSMPPPPARPAPEPAPNAVAASSNPQCPSKRPYRLLIAEDSVSNRELIRLFLENEPVAITMAGTGREALALFAPGAFDLILMDMEMPEMDGCAATEAIRRLEAASGTWRTPVLMLSAHAFAEYEQKGLSAGCDGFMTKPVRKSELINALRRVLDGRPIHAASER